MVADLVRVVFRDALLRVAERWALALAVEMVLAFLWVLVLVRAVALRCVVELILPEAFLCVEALALWL